MKTLEDLLAMPLNSWLEIKTDLYILRVPGGWIYSWLGESSQTFVPEPLFKENIP